MKNLLIHQFYFVFIGVIFFLTRNFILYWKSCYSVLWSTIPVLFYPSHKFYYHSFKKKSTVIFLISLVVEIEFWGLLHCSWWLGQTFFLLIAPHLLVLHFTCTLWKHPDDLCGVLGEHIGIYRFWLSKTRLPLKNFQNIMQKSRLNKLVFFFLVT